MSKKHHFTTSNFESYINITWKICWTHIYRVENILCYWSFTLLAFIAFVVHFCTYTMYNTCIISSSVYFIILDRLYIYIYKTISYHIWVSIKVTRIMHANQESQWVSIKDTRVKLSSWGSYYHITLATSSQFIIFSEMLKFSPQKKILIEFFFVKENE